MDSIHLHTCPVCGSKNIVKAFDCKDYYATQELFEIHRCSTCLFLFTQNFPNEANIDKYYDTAVYISHSDNKKGLVNKLYHSIRKIMLKQKARIITKHAGNTGNILDIGCGIGYFLGHMKQQGYEVTGIEKNDYARNAAIKQFSINCYASEKLNSLNKESFDIITFWHSLEHLEKLNETINTIHSLLKKNGTVFIAVPNANSADARYYKEKWAAYDVPRHLWHFTAETMKQLLEKAGFYIETIYPMPFDAFYVAMLSEKYKNKPLAFLTGLFIGLWCFIKSKHQIKASSSLIFVAKK